MKKEQLIEILEKEGKEITCQTENMTIYWDRDDSIKAILALQPTDLDIDRWAVSRVNEIDPSKWGYGDLLIEGAEWCRDFERKTNY